MSTVMTTNPTSGRWAWLRNWAPVLVAGLILLMVWTTHTVSSQSRAEELSAARGQTEQLRADLVQAQAEAEQAKAETVQAATGQRVEVKAADDTEVKSLMETALNWSSAEEYVKARQDVAQRWKLGEDTQFMKVFLPGEAEGAFRRDDSGQLHFAYPGANSEMGGFTSIMTSVSGDERQYFAIVESTTTSPAGGRVLNRVAVEYTVRGEGQIVDVKAYPAGAESDRSA